MKQNAIKAIANNLREVVDGARDTSFDDEPKKLERLISREGSSYKLIDHHVDLLESIVRTLLKSYSEKFTEKYVEKKIYDIIADCLREPNKEADIELMIEGVISDLEVFNEEWIVVVPIDGLTMNEIEILNIGPICLFIMNDNSYDDLLKSFEHVISTLKNPENQQEAIKARFTETITNYRGKVCARYRVVADPDRAIERAKEQIRLVLDILSLSIPIFYSEVHKVRVGLLGEVISQSRAIPLISSALDHTYLKRERVGSLTKFELTPEKLKRLDEWNILSLVELLGNGKLLYDFHLTLLRSIRWFSHAISQDNIEIKFLCIVVALETLLVPLENSPITNAIAEGAALVLGEDLTARKEIKTRVKKLYALRSAVAHGGKKPILNSDLKNIQNVTLDLILKLSLKIEFKTHKQFIDWIEDQKLG